MSAPLSPTDFTADEAREFTDDLKLDYVILQGKIAQAFKGKIWIALGYEDWADYITAEFGGLRIRPPKETELKAIQELSAADMSSRDIAAAYGIHHSTVAEKLKQLRAPREVEGDSGEAQESVGNPTPGSIQERSRQGDLEDTEIVDEGERSQGPPGSGSEWSSNGRIDADRTPASEFGFEPMDIDSEQNGIQISESEVCRRRVNNGHLATDEFWTV